MPRARAHEAPEQARYLEGRLWHRRQKVRRLRSGWLDVRFRPVNPGEASSWIWQWGPSVKIVGDRKLLRYMASASHHGSRAPG